MAAIDEISRRLESTKHMISYFFFHSGMPNFNNPSAMVRSLTYLLFKGEADAVLVPAPEGR